MGQKTVILPASTKIARTWLSALLLEQATAHHATAPDHINFFADVIHGFEFACLRYGHWVY